MSWRRFSVVATALLGAEPRLEAQPLTRAIEIRSLTPVQAEMGLEATLKGVVIFIEPAAVFVQDESSTTFFRPAALGGLRPGDEVEVRGKTRMGLYLPGLATSDFRIIGHRPLPDGIAVGYDDLVLARYHYQRVAVAGVVRSVEELGPSRSLLRLAMGSRAIEIRIEAPLHSRRTLVDARVQVTGLAAGFINERRQLVQPYVRVLDWNDVGVVDEAPPLGEVPPLSAAELLAFRLSGHGDRRVSIDGVVIAAWPDGMLFLRQADMAFGARLRPVVRVDCGDRVRLLGFPEMDRFSGSVVDAEIARREPGDPPAPVPVGSVDALTGQHDGNLVRVEGTLAEVFKSDNGSVLAIRGRTRMLQATLTEGALELAPGSRVSLTGICRVVPEAGAGFSSTVAAVNLRLRDVADVSILQRPSWWTVRRLGYLLSALGGLTLTAGLWIAILRRQVRRQTEALRRRIASEAVLEERQRIAREFHDTLEQELAGVTLRLDALATRSLDDKGRSLAAASRSLVSRIQDETRNLISDLRDPGELSGDLVAAVAAVAARFSSDTGVEIRVEAPAPISVLPAGAVHDLRMIARESVNNALKHADATEIVIRLGLWESGGNGLRMEICDNGRGFDPSQAVARAAQGRFGCAGIRERCRKLGARVDWHSAPGQGTRVEVALPGPSTDERQAGS